MDELRKVFISHSHKDEPLAAAFKQTLKEIFNEVQVPFSSDKDAGGGPEGGQNWLAWIHRKMLECQVSLLLLTPYSIQKPWPMWEAGAVAGIALANTNDASGQTFDKRVVPIRFNIPQESLPGPFVVTQAYDGTSKASLQKLLADLLKRYSNNTPKVIDSTAAQSAAELFERVQKWLSNAPSTVSEGTISEWCARLDALQREKKSGSVLHLHRWIQLMYEGPRNDERDAETWRASAVPWDIRIHLRLAENYALAGQLKHAIGQYELASRLAPLDVFVLYQLAKSHLEQGEPDDARRIIDRILELDKDALKWNAEVAGLEGRYWKDQAKRAMQTGFSQQAMEHYRKARDAYQAALASEGDHASFYLADNVGQLSLTLGEVDAARQAYKAAERALKKVTPETENVWSLATRATTELVNGDEALALTLLRRIRDLTPPPTADECASVRNGLELLRQGMQKNDSEHKKWLEALGP